MLELGAGTSLPGLLCAKVGATRVFLADVAADQSALDNCREAVRLNSLEDRVEVVGITWGCHEPDLLRMRQRRVDLVVGSDLFFDPGVFDPLCCTLSFLLDEYGRESEGDERKALVAVQDRSGDWSLDEHLERWKLQARVIHPREFLRGTGIEEGDLAGRHTIVILEIRARKGQGAAN